MLAVLGYATGGITGHKKNCCYYGHTSPTDNNRIIYNNYMSIENVVQDCIAKHLLIDWRKYE